MTVHQTPPPGWYPTEGTDKQRYWDGQQWLDRFQQAGPAGSTYASFFSRALGYLVDAVVLTVPFVALVLALGASLVLENPDVDLLQEGPVPFLVLVGLILLVQGVYFVVCLHVWGRTLGGQLAGIRCVDREGNWPSWGASCIRYAVTFGFSLLGLAGMPATAGAVVNYLWMLWDPNKQCLMDKAAGTYVVTAGSLNR